MISQIRNLIGSLGLVLFTLGIGCSAYQKTGEADKGLFSEISYRGKIDEVMKSRIIRYRFVRVNFHMIAGTKEAYHGPAKSGGALQLNLFEDVVVKAVLDRREVRSDKSFTWLGRIEGIEDSQVTLVVEERVMVGNIRIRQTYYQVRYASEGVHVIYQIDPNAFPPDSQPLMVPGHQK